MHSLIEVFKRLLEVELEDHPRPTDGSRNAVSDCGRVFQILLSEGIKILAKGLVRNITFNQ